MTVKIARRRPTSLLRRLASSRVAPGALAHLLQVGICKMKIKNKLVLAFVLVAFKPQDIAAAVAYAVSEDAGWVTGTTLDVAGGMTF